MSSLLCRRCHLIVSSLRQMRKERRDDDRTDGKINSLKRQIIIDIKRRRVDPPSFRWEKSTNNKRKKSYQATEKIKDDEEVERIRRGEE